MTRRILQLSARCAGLLAVGSLSSSIFIGCSEDQDPNTVTPSGGAAGAAGASGVAGAGAIGVDSGGASGASGAGGADGGVDATLPRCMSLEPLARCGTQGVQAQIKVANILLVIDKSGSMDDTPDRLSEQQVAGLEERARRRRCRRSPTTSISGFCSIRSPRPERFRRIARLTNAARFRMEPARSMSRSRSGPRRCPRSRRLWTGRLPVAGRQRQRRSLARTSTSPPVPVRRSRATST